MPEKYYIEISHLICSRGPAGAGRHDLRVRGHEPPGHLVPRDAVDDVAAHRGEVRLALRERARSRWSFVEGSFSAVSKPTFARKYAFESSRRDLQNALLRTMFQL